LLSRLSARYPEKISGKRVTTSNRMREGSVALLG
jgi:hypothetical protein